MNSKRSGVSIRVLPSGSFQVRYRLRTGEQVSDGTYKTRDEAELRKKELEVDLERGLHWDDRKSKFKFEVFMERYMAFRETQVEASTFRNDRSILKVHVLPTFGHRQMRQIDEEFVDLWWASMPETVYRRNAYMFLTKAMDFAVKWKYLRVNPCQVEKAGKMVAKKRPAFTLEQVFRMAEHADEQTRVMVLVALDAQLRIGELCGLERRDYDPATGSLTVERQLSIVGPKATKGTKTGWEGAVTVMEDGRAALDEWVRTHPMLPNAPLFTNTKGGRIDRHGVHKGFDAACASAGVEGMNFHDLKRVGLTEFARTPGVTTKDLMLRGRHTSPSTSIGYLDAGQDRDAEMAALASERRRARRMG